MSQASQPSETFNTQPSPTDDSRNPFYEMNSLQKEKLTMLPNLGNSHYEPIEFEFMLFQSRLPCDDLYNDELNSCHLTLTLPDKPPVDKTGYPVMVWFNGGGFMIGSAAWPQYNPTKMAAVANDHGRPTIIVVVNYRVGIFGNMAS